MTQEIIDDKKVEENLFNFGIVDSPLVKQTRDELENMVTPSEPEMPLYGALPYFKDRKKIIANLSNELSYFDYDLVPEEKGKQKLSRASEGILLFEMKAGFPLSKLSEQIIGNYPDAHKQGKIVSIFGLSGSGKSVALEGIKEKYNDSAILIDNDTSRYNLLAKIVNDAERASGKTTEQVKASKVIHNSISNPFYLLLNYVVSELKNRGYTVFRASTLPDDNADVGFYIEHPDTIDPISLSNAGEDKIKETAVKLSERTSQRVDGKDNYNWDTPEMITKFEDMKTVTVRVPPVAHERFIKNVGNKLENGQYITLHNPKAETVDEAKKAIIDQIKTVLK